MKAPVTEHEDEPLPGLPDELPTGERLLWQGAPRWTSLALHAYRLQALGVYFAVLVASRGLYLAATGASAGDAIAGCAGPALVALVALAILAAVAWGAARTTMYTITSKRVVIRQGIALSTTVNLPFGAVESAATVVRSDGCGDIALKLVRHQRVSYLLLWPHVRPWRLLDPQPSLRDIPDVEHVGGILTRAVAASAAIATVRPQASHAIERPTAPVTA